MMLTYRSIRLSLSVSLILAVSVFSATKTQAGLIVNGGFETGDFTGWSVNVSPPDNAALIIDDTAFPGHDRIFAGTYALNFSTNGVPATAVLTQTIATNNNIEYHLNYAFGVVALSDRSASLLVEILGADGTTVLAMQSPSRLGVNGGSTATTVYTTELLSFTADGNTATVRFTDTTNPSNASDAVLDSVSVTTAAVPEPSSLALLAIGSVCMLAARRRRL